MPNENGYVCCAVSRHKRPLGQDCQTGRFCCVFGMNDRESSTTSCSPMERQYVSSEQRTKIDSDSAEPPPA